MEGITHPPIGEQQDAARPKAIPGSKALDMDLVQRIRSGDQNAFSEIYLKYRKNVHRFILMRVNDQSEADDLTQDTFVEAYRSIGGFEGRSRLLTWLLGIARHQCMRFYRFGSRWMIGSHADRSVEDQGFESRTDSRVDAILTLDRCGDILNRHRSPAAQLIFHLHFNAGLPNREIATLVDQSADSVKASLWRSRRVLKRNLATLSATAEVAM